MTRRPRWCSSARATSSVVVPILMNSEAWSGMCWRHELGRCAASPRQLQDLARLVGDVLDARRQPGPAVIAAQEVLGAELVDVAPDGLRRHREMLGQLLDRDEAALAHQVQDLPLALVLGHGPHASRGRRESAKFGRE